MRNIYIYRIPAKNNQYHLLVGLFPNVEDNIEISNLIFTLDMFNDSKVYNFNKFIKDNITGSANNSLWDKLANHFNYRKGIITKYVRSRELALRFFPEDRKLNVFHEEAHCCYNDEKFLIERTLLKESISKDVDVFDGVSGCKDNRIDKFDFFMIPDCQYDELMNEIRNFSLNENIPVYKCMKEPMEIGTEKFNGFYVNVRELIRTDFDIIGDECIEKYGNEIDDVEKVMTVIYYLKDCMIDRENIYKLYDEIKKSNCKHSMSSKCQYASDESQLRCAHISKNDEDIVIKFVIMSLIDKFPELNQ